MRSNGRKVSIEYHDGFYIVNAGGLSFSTLRRSAAIQRYRELRKIR